MTTTPQPQTSLYGLGMAAQAIAQEINRAAELLGSDDPEERDTGRVVLEEYLAAEDATKDAINEKADAVCHVVRLLHAQAAFRAEESKRLGALAKADLARADKLTDYMVHVLTTLDPGKTKFSLPHHELTSRQSTRVEVDEDVDLPDEFLARRVIEEVKPDKDAIKRALQSGASIPGALLRTVRNWKIG